jgi:hypothetical protein
MLSNLGCKSNSNSTASGNQDPSAIKITAFEASKDYPDAAINSMDYRNGKFTIGIEGDFILGEQTPDAPQKMCANSAQGQHIHLIVNNKPYEAKYETPFHHYIEDGEHYVLAFLSRSYHESIKTPRASVLVHAVILDSSFQKLEPVMHPMVFYSRPKGVYIGEDTKKIMLDFYLANCKLGDKFKIKAEIDSKEFIIDKWQPYYIEGLSMGEHKIKLSLIDSTGALVSSPLNPVERSFTLQAEPGK